MRSHLKCDECGDVLYLDTDPAVVVAQIITFVEAHNAHERMAVHVEINA